MKHLKKFENNNDENKTIIRFCNYVIDNSNLKRYNDGFMDYSILDYNNNLEYYTYFFKFDLEMFGDYEIGIKKLITFLKSIDAKNIKRRKFKSYKIEISFDIEKIRAKELAELYMNINKYNL